MLSPDHPLAGRTVLFVHAHPDDESIFTAATMHALAGAGARVVLVVATAGELGDPLIPLPADADIGAHRIGELERSAEALGVARIVLLGRRDSGCPGWPANSHPAALVQADLRALAHRVADLAAAENAEAVVGYDPHGIYGHPDHVAVHQLADRAAALAGATSYQATVETGHVLRHGVHLVLGAAPATGAGQVGVDDELLSLTYHASPADLLAKRRSMAAHASQISGAHLKDPGFDAAYGQEWYLRRGRQAALDLLVDSLQAGKRSAAALQPV